jgi:hypothetical protein
MPARLRTVLALACRRDASATAHSALGGRANLAGSLEVFNLFNRKNYGAYDLTETSGTFLQPQPLTNLSYAPRTLQLGFRVTF